MEALIFSVMMILHSHADDFCCNGPRVDVVDALASSGLKIILERLEASRELHTVAC